MAASTSSMERLSRRYPNYPSKCAVIGDSIMRYVHTHFSPNDPATPCFISYGGAMYSDVPALLEYLPENVETLLLHVGTTDIVKTGCSKSLDSLREALRRVRQVRSDITTVHISLPLPRAPNRRRRDSNSCFVSWFNREVQRFNKEARRLCHCGMLGAGRHGEQRQPLARPTPVISPLNNGLPRNTEPPRALAVTTSPLPPARRYNTRRTYVATTKAATSN
ncbi:hypothetical protein HPB52_021328 [Rhipicephalus sanguineus]|uniref:Uncharacterized protein n=1 Tax=Rhipicephalus sanguineus TaxID=34632 RepID=A0A9D4SNV9_RHISA|nr:hypothetical protein HPB52_021328 [Rhipicephalus sanguineus]